jgi:type I restriction enzyme M protein
MVALPGQLFFSTQIPVCLWFLTRSKGDPMGRPYGRDRRGETLFIDARKMGILIDRVHRDLTEEDIAKIAGTYHAWKKSGTVIEDDSMIDYDEKTPNLSPSNNHSKHSSDYLDIPGFCKSATLQEIREQGYVLTPGRYVGAAELEEDDEPFEQKMARLTKELEGQFEESRKLEHLIKTSIIRLEHE